MKKIIIVGLFSLIFSTTVFAEDDLTAGIQDNGTATNRAVFLQAESLRTQREILTNLQVMNEQIAEQNVLLKQINSKLNNPANAKTINDIMQKNEINKN